MRQRSAIRAPYAAASLPALAAVAAAARWLVQGSGNLYTATDKRFYLPDPDLGWRIATDGPLWIGLDLIAGLVALTAAVFAGAWLLGRRERARGQRWPVARLVLWAAGVPALAVPLWAFAEGLGPADGREELPAGVIGPPTGTIEGAIAGLPAGAYQVVPDSDSAITASVAAGGETFDARFTGGLDGTLRFDPNDLTAPAEASFRVDAASVDTGVTMRSKHARSDDFLDAERFPEIGFELTELTSARQGSDAGEVVFWAEGAVTLMGERVEVTAEGTMRALDEAARRRLGASRQALLISASFTLALADTPLSREDFDAGELPIRATLIAAHQPDNHSNK